jgi:hypothetical protein
VLFGLRSDRSLERKAKELMLAVELERRLTKTEILQRYVNVVFWGGNVYGIRAAAQTYFGKDPSELTLAEGLYLARLIPAPNVRHNDFARHPRQHAGGAEQHGPARHDQPRGRRPGLAPTDPAPRLGGRLRRRGRRDRGGSHRRRGGRAVEHQHRPVAGRADLGAQLPDRSASASPSCSGRVACA